MLPIRKYNILTTASSLSSSSDEEQEMTASASTHRIFSKSEEKSTNVETEPQEFDDYAFSVGDDDDSLYIIVFTPSINNRH